MDLLEIVINIKIIDMRKILILTTVILAIISCSKEISDLDKTGNNTLNEPLLSTSALISNFILPDDINSEGERISNDVFDPKYTIAVIDNPNFGTFSSTPEYDIIFGGKSPSNIKIKLNGDEYTPSTNGQWFGQGIEYKNYYGKNVLVEIFENDNLLESSSIYVPRPILTNKLGSVGSQEISRTGNTLTWDADNTGNSSNKVALIYYLYDNNNIGSEEGLYERNLLLLDNNGLYNLDGILADTECKKIYFRLVNGSTVSCNVNGSEKLLVHISTFNHHEYIVGD